MPAELVRPVGGWSRAPTAKGLTLSIGGTIVAKMMLRGNKNVWDIEKSFPRRALPSRLTTWRVTKHTGYFRALQR